MSIVRNILVRVGADLSDMTKQLNEAKKFMSKAGKDLKNVGEDMTKYVTAPILGIGAISVKAAADFEQGMSNIKAVSGVAGKEFDALKNLAIEMGAKTKYSAKEAAAGIEELIKAGVSVKDIMAGGLEGALSLAAAGELELAEAAEIASTALNAFKADNLSVSKAADILAGAANASATSVQEMKFGLAASAAVASGVGMTFKDTSTAIGLFANNGLKGSDAGTSLKTMLMNLQPATKEQKQLFQQLGLTTKEGTSIFFDQAGKLKSLSDIAGILNKSMNGLNDAQRLAAMETLFGSDAIRAANILYKEGATGVNNLATEMTKFTAAQVAAEKQNNLKGQIEQLKGGMETLAIQIGTILIPAINELVTKYIAPAVQWFSSLDTEAQKQIVTFAGLAAAIGPALLVLGQAATVISTVIGFVKGAVVALGALQAGTAGLGVTLTAIFGPAGVVILVIAAIAALVAGIVYLWNTNDQFKNALLAAWEYIKMAAMTIFTALQEFWQAWGGTIISIFTTLFEIVKIIFTKPFEDITFVVKTIFNGLKAFWDEWGGAITVVFTAIWEHIKAVFEHALKQLNEILQLVLSIMKGDWAGAWEHIKNIFGNSKDFLLKELKIFKDMFVGIFEEMKNKVLGVFEGMMKKVKESIQWVKDTAGSIGNSITGGSSSKKSSGSGGGSSAIENNIRTPIVPHASGGIFTKPTLWGNHLIGEAGDEALLPLSKLDGMIGGGENIINVYMDGTLIASQVDSRLGNKLVALGGT